MFKNIKNYFQKINHGNLLNIFKSSELNSLKDQKNSVELFIFDNLLKNFFIEVKKQKYPENYKDIFQYNDKNNKVNIELFENFNETQEEIIQNNVINEKNMSTIISDDIVGGTPKILLRNVKDIIDVYNEILFFENLKETKIEFNDIASRKMTFQSIKKNVSKLISKKKEKVQLNENLINIKNDIVKYHSIYINESRIKKILINFYNKYYTDSRYKNPTMNYLTGYIITLLYYLSINSSSPHVIKLCIAIVKFLVSLINRFYEFNEIDQYYWFHKIAIQNILNNLNLNEDKYKYIGLFHIDKISEFVKNLPKLNVNYIMVIIDRTMMKFNKKIFSIKKNNNYATIAFSFAYVCIFISISFFVMAAFGLFPFSFILFSVYYPFISSGFINLLLGMYLEHKELFNEKDYEIMKNEISKIDKEELISSIVSQFKDKKENEEKQSKEENQTEVVNDNLGSERFVL